MTDSGEYKSNPKLQTLAAELSLLNTQLIELGLSDKARMLRLRMFAESSLAFPTSEPITRRRKSRKSETNGLFEIFTTLARSTNMPRHLQDAFIEIAGCFQPGQQVRVSDETVASESQTPGGIEKIDFVSHCETQPQSSFRANPVFSVPAQ